MFDDTHTLNTIFSLTSMLAMIGWATLILLPRRWSWLLSVPALIVPGLIALAYVALIAAALGGNGNPDAGFSSLAAVRALFESDTALLAGWLHYLAFDLLVGLAIARAEDEAGIHRAIQAPVLIATFLFGPAGFLLHMMLTGARRLSGSAQGKTA